MSPTPDVIGSAFIDIRARVSNLEKDVAVQTKAAMGAATAEVDAAAAPMAAASGRAASGITRELDSAGTRAAKTMRTSMKDVAASAGIPAGIFKLAIPAAIGVTAVAAVKMASTFQRSMELVHTQAGASQMEVNSLKNSVLALGGKVAQSPNELAAGLYHIESAGFRGSQALNILTAAAKGATIGNADLEDVSQAMIATLASGIKGVSGASDAMADLNRTVGIGDMRMSGLAQAMSTGILPSARSAGLSLQDVSAALATITDNATPPTEAATRLRMTFSLLAAPTATATKALATIGLTGTTLASDMRKPQGLLVAIDDLKKHLIDSGDTAVQQNAVIARAFGGGRTSGSILTLIEESDRLKSKYDELGTAAERQQSQQEAWSKTQATFDVQWHMLTADVDAFMIKLGNGLLPVATDMTHWMTTAGVSGITTFMHAFSSGGAAAGIMSDLESAVGHVGSAIKNVVTATAPFDRVLLMAAGGGVLIAFRVLGSVIDGVAHAVDAATGFFARNQVAMDALAGLIVASLIPAISATVTEFGAMAVLGIESVFARISAAVSGMVIAFGEADGAIAGFGAALDTLDINPVGLGIAAIGATIGLLAYVFQRNAQSTRQATDAVDAYVKSLQVNYNMASTVSAAESSITDKIKERTNALFDQVVAAEKANTALVPGQYMTDEPLKTQVAFRAELASQDPVIKQYRSQLAQMVVANKAATNNTNMLSMSLHASRPSILAAANALGLQLNGAYASLAPKISAYIQSAELSHHPTQQAAADFKDLGNKANDVTTDVQRLDSAWSELVGNFVGMKQAQLDAKQGLTALDVALKKSHDSLSLNTAAGQAARGALLSLVPQISTVVDATYTQTGSYSKAAAAAKVWLNGIKSSGAAGPMVTRLTNGITRDLASLAKKTPGLGKSTGVGYGTGLIVGMDATASDVATHAARLAGLMVQATNSRIKKKSPARVAVESGMAWGQGLIVGMDSMAAGVAKSAANLGHLMVMPGPGVTGGGVPSFNVLAGDPSKYGKTIIRGLTQGIGDHSPEFQKAVTGLTSFLDGQLKSSVLATQEHGKKLVEALVTGIEAERTRLQTTIGKVKSDLSTVRGNAASLKSSIVSSMSGLGDITNLQSSDTSGHNLISYLSGNLKDVKAFQRNLATLKHKGLSQAVINQIAAAGIGQGSQEAASLVGASGGQIAKIDAMSKAINKAANAIGSKEATATFGKHIAKINTHLDALDVTLKLLNKTITAQQLDEKLARKDKAPVKPKTTTTTTTSKTGTHDGGGWLAPGVHGDVVNATGRSEAVMPQDVMFDAIVRAIHAATGSGRSVPLIGHADIHNEGDVEAIFRRLEFLVGGSTL